MIDRLESSDLSELCSHDFIEIGGVLMTTHGGSGAAGQSGRRCVLLSMLLMVRMISSSVAHHLVGEVLPTMSL